MNSLILAKNDLPATVNVILTEINESKRSEFILSNKELVFQNKEKEHRAIELGIANDSLRESERQLRDSEDLFRSSFDNDLDAVLLTRPGGSILDANIEAQRLFGQGKDELRQLGVCGLLDTAEPRFEAALINHENDGGVSNELMLIAEAAGELPPNYSRRFLLA